jgi:hypothetical protein
MSVIQTIFTFLRAERLPKDWITPQTLHLIFRNILLEERQDVRELSIRTWNHAIDHLDNSGFYLACIEPFIQEWFNLALIPTVDGYTSLAFAKANVGARRDADAHDVDKAMMASDFSLIDEDLVLRNRLDAVVALTRVACLGHANVSYHSNLDDSRCIKLTLKHSTEHFHKPTVQLSAVDQRTPVDSVWGFRTGLGTGDFRSRNPFRRSSSRKRPSN